MSIVAAYIFAGLICVASAFQVALAAGAPWGRLAMGGRWPGRFPPPLRLLAIVQMGMLLAMGMIVLTRAGIILSEWRNASTILIWIVVAMCTLAAIGNLATPSKWERIIWGPVAAAMLISSVVVAVGSSDL